MGKKDDDFEFPGSREAEMTGTATRTRKLWKKNGNLKTLGKELDRLTRKYPPETLSSQVGIRRRRRVAA
jgi:hypothetical protein